MELLFKQINTLDQLTHGNIRTFSRTRQLERNQLKDFKKKFDEQEETNAVGLMNHGAMTELRRDRIDDASVHYLNEQRGMSTILLNSLAGGLGYREARVEKEAKDKN